MHAPSARHRNRAFTKVEFLVVIAAIAVISVVAIAALAKAKQRAKRIQCINNQKQISTGFRLFASDTGAPYGEYIFALLSYTSNSDPGLRPFATNNPAELWKLFQMAADDFVLASSLVCPADRGRVAADRFGTNGLATELSHPSNRLNALSYFLSLNASEASPDHILMGDRHVTTDPEASSETETKFLFGEQDIGSLSAMTPSVRWISTVHGGGGNASFMDGSSQQLTSAKFRTAMRNQSIGSNRIWLPNSDATGRGNP